VGGILKTIFTEIIIPLFHINLKVTCIEFIIFKLLGNLSENVRTNFFNLLPLFYKKDMVLWFSHLIII
jgi:hypothetical protein